MYEYDFHTYSVRRKKSKKRFIFLVCFVGCLILLFFLISPGKNNQEKKTLGKTTDSKIIQRMNTNTALEAAVTEALVDTQGSYAVSIINKKTGESYMRNEQHVYDAASLYKLWIMAVVFQQIQQGKLKEDTVLEQDVQELNKKFHIASESAELSEGTVRFTVASALRQMITISHNYAALLLTEKVKLSTVAAFLATNGFDKSQVSRGDRPPVTTASDIALFYEKLLQGALANETYTAKMIDLLKEQRLDNKLPRYLSDDVVIAHKTGELGLFSHDGGIVYLPNGEYIIVVMSETKYPPAAEERVSQISKNVYEYFTK